MDGITKKKLNLLVHLAHIDGSFHHSEKEMLTKLAGDSRAFDNAGGNPFEAIEEITDKEEVMYLAIKLIQADQVITEEELTFCRKLAKKLGFREQVVDHFAHSSLPAVNVFVKQINNWRN